MTNSKAVEMLKDFAEAIHPFSSSDLDRALELAIKALQENEHED